MLSRLAILMLLSSIAIAQSGCNYEILKANDRRFSGAGQSGEKPTATLDFEALKTTVLEARCIECHNPGKNDDGDFTTYAGVMEFVTPGEPGASEFYTKLQNVRGKMPKNRARIPDDEATMIRAWIEGGAIEKALVPKPEAPVTGEPQPVPAPGTEPAPQPNPAPGTEPVPEPGPQPQPNPAPGTDPRPAPQPAPEPGPQPLPLPPGPGTNPPNPVPPRPPAPPQTSPLEATFASINSNVIVPKCVQCHSGADPKGDVDLSSYDAIIKHMDTEADTDLVRPSDSEKSLLYIVIRDEEMPRKKDIKAGKAIPVTPEELEAIKAWIDGGAHP